MAKLEKQITVYKRSKDLNCEHVRHVSEKFDKMKLRFAQIVKGLNEKLEKTRWKLAAAHVDSVYNESNLKQLSIIRDALKVAITEVQIEDQN